MARPRIKIDWEQLDKLCQMQCTKVEIADWFDCSEDTIERAIKRKHKVGFAVYYNKKRVAGIISLRRNQFQLSAKFPAMAIWLGKQYLDQKDKQEVELIKPIDEIEFDGL